VATVNTNSNGAYFLNGNGIWAIPPDTAGGGTLNAATWGCAVSGTTVVLETNNYAGIGSTMFLAIAGSSATPNNVVTSDFAGGTWRVMTDGVSVEPSDFNPGYSKVVCQRIA
jgi:hypothetical protein